MFDWVLNTSEYYNNFFSWRFQIKINEFFKFFSTINFSYQYLPEAKAYLEPSRTFYNGAFSRNIVFCKIHKKTPVLGSHINKVIGNKVIGLYPAISLNGRTPTQAFSLEFCEILKTPFLQNTSRRLLLFYGKNILSTK